MVKKKGILIVDDHPLVREGLKVIIGRSSKFEVVGEAGGAREGLRMAEQLKPDLLLLDISLPDEGGIELTRRIKSALPEARILILSMHSKIDYITEAFKAGATGYMVKESAAERLLTALESVATIPTDPVRPGPDVADLLEGMSRTGFQGRRLGESFRIWSEMIHDPDAPSFWGSRGP